MTSISKTAPFLTVIENHKGIIYKVANAYCKLEADRKDLVQEIILQLWKSFDKYNDQFKYSTWIYRISLNVAISFFRKESTRKNISNPLSDQIFNIGHLQENKQKEDKIFENIGNAALTTGDTVVKVGSNLSEGA